MFEGLERTFTHQDESRVELVLSAWEAEQTVKAKGQLLTPGKTKVTTALLGLTVNGIYVAAEFSRMGGLVGEGSRTLGLQRHPEASGGGCKGEGAPSGAKVWGQDGGTPMRSFSRYSRALFQNAQGFRGLAPHSALSSPDPGHLGPFLSRWPSPRPGLAPI